MWKSVSQSSCSNHFQEEKFHPKYKNTENEFCYIKALTTGKGLKSMWNLKWNSGEEEGKSEVLCKLSGEGTKEARGVLESCEKRIKTQRKASSSHSITKKQSIKKMCFTALTEEGALNIEILRNLPRPMNTRMYSSPV